MGIFGKGVKASYDEKDLPPVPENEIGEVQKLAELIWEFENHGSVTWKQLRQFHEDGDNKAATELYKDRIAISNHILERYQPRE